MHSKEIIPLFPLGLVMLPEMSLPLHIFEERYKLMTKVCIDQRQEFGIVYFNGQDLQTVGCTARIEKILKRYPDGRLDIETRGANRFSTSELFDDKPYLQAQIEYFDDTPTADSDRKKFQKLAARGLQLLGQINAAAASAKENLLARQPDYKAVSFILAACEEFSLEEKQRFLEMTSTAKRLSSAVEALEKLFERIQITRKIARIIGGNGNLPERL